MTQPGRRFQILQLSVVIPGWSEGPDPESRDSGFDASHRPGMTGIKKGPLARASPVNIYGRSAVMVVAVMMVTIAAMREPHRLQFDVGHAGRDVEPGLALHADRLQRVGILRTADQEIAAAADPDRGVGADAAVIAGEIAAADPVGRGAHRPGQAGVVGDPEIKPDAAQRCNVGFGTVAVALEHAFEAGRRSHDEADILAALALQEAGAHRLHRAGASERGCERSDGDS